MHSKYWAVGLLVVSLLEAAIVTVLHVEGTHWDEIHLLKGGYGGSTVDVWGATLVRTVILWATCLYLLAAAPMHLTRRAKILVSLRYLWFALTTLWQTYLFSKCLARLVAGPGEGAIGSEWFWPIIALTSVLCYCDCYILAHKLLKKELWYGSRLGDDEESAPLLTSRHDGYKVLQEDAINKPHRASIGKLIGLSAPDTVPLVVANLCLIVAAAGQAYIPALTGKIIDYVAVQHDTAAFMHCSGILLLTTFVCAIFTGIRGTIFQLCISRLTIRIRLMLMESLLRQDIGFFDTNKSGEILSRLNNDTNKMADSIGLNMNIFLRSIVQGIGVLVFMVFLSWKLTLVTFVTVPVVVVLTKVFGDYYRKLSEESLDHMGKTSSIAQEALGNMTTVRAFASEKEELKGYAQGLHKFYEMSVTKAYLYSAYSLIFTILPNLVSTLVLFYGGKLVIEDEITGGDLVSFMLYQQALSGNFDAMANVFSGFTEALGAADKVFELIYREPEVRTDGHIKTNDEFKGKIQLEDIVFRYPARPEVTVMNGLNVEVQPGEVVALVGPSGGGKSSVINLVEHFYEPASGKVLIDGLDIGDYDHEFLHEKVVLVGQEPVLFARSIKDNIIYGLKGTHREPTMDEIMQAAKMANAHDFILTFPQGYDTEVGEKGVQLSGGQKQRIAIARALVRKPTVLLLDEATSALDAESESVVQEAIDSIMRNKMCTVLVIAHRLSTVRNADRIVVVGQGKVLESGKHDDLVALDGVYAKLVQKQLAGSSSPMPPHKGLTV
eukprot:comp22331_c0_seq1/m.33194 comp22331_c0_seq1/g.33194  ORF comp22331_c0_seq1/g.33194 comp22331_c0_seq1/m.33194 type:complete len:778 (-) comp22331_c0_seq1:469-2802(-)